MANVDVVLCIVCGLQCIVSSSWRHDLSASSVVTRYSSYAFFPLSVSFPSPQFFLLSDATYWPCRRRCTRIFH